METFKDEIKNLKAITRVIAALVLANFVIIAVVLGPDSVGFDPTYGPITAILNFVIAFLTTGVLLGIYIVFDVKQTFDLSHMHNILFVSVTVQMLFALGSVFNYYSVFETVLDTDTVGAISGSFTSTIFFLYGMYIYLLVRTDKRRGNLLSKRTQTIGTIFSGIIMMNTKTLKNTYLKITIGLFLSVVIYYINNFFFIMGTSEKISVIGSIFIPLSVFAIINLIFVRNLNAK